METMNRWETSFGRFVKEYGSARLANELQVTPGAVYSWTRSTAMPRPDKAQAIVQLSGGQLTLEDIYRHRCEVKE